MNSKRPRVTETIVQPPAKVAKRPRGRPKKVEISSLKIPKKANAGQKLKKCDSKPSPGSEPAEKKSLTKESSDKGTLKPPTNSQMERFSDFRAGQLVWAFQQGFPMWPGMIQSVCSKTGAAVITFIGERNGKAYISTTELLPQTHPEMEVIKDFAPNFANLTKSGKRWKKQAERRSIFRAIQMVCEEKGLSCPEEPKKLWEFAKSDAFASLAKIVVTQDVYNKCFEGIPQGLVPTPKHKRVKLISDNLEDSSASAAHMKGQHVGESSTEENVQTLPFIRRTVSARKSINGRRAPNLISVALPPQVEHDDSGYEPKELVNESRDNEASGSVEETSEEDSGAAVQPDNGRKHKCNRCGAKFTIELYLSEHKWNMKHWDVCEDVVVIE